MSLTTKQKRAADYYIVYGDKVQALREAGYSNKTAVEKFFNNKNILDYLQQHTSRSEIATMEEIMIYLTRVMKGAEAEKECVVIKTGKDTTDVKEVEKPIGVTLRLRAAEMLIKWLSGNGDIDNTPVVINDDLEKN